MNVSLRKDGGSANEMSPCVWFLGNLQQTFSCSDGRGPLLSFLVTFAQYCQGSGRPLKVTRFSVGNNKRCFKSYFVEAEL